MNNSYYIISLIGAAQGGLLGCLLFVRKGYHPAAKVLGAYVLIFSLGLLERFCEQYMPAGIFKKIWMAFLGFSNFLYGPLLFLFVDYLVKDSPRFKIKNFLHLLPFVLGFTIAMICMLQPTAGKYGVDEVMEFIFFELLLAQILTYNMLAVKKLNIYRLHVLQYYSTIGPKDLSWLRSVIVFITSIYITSFLITHLILFGVPLSQDYYIIVQLAITLSIYLLSYRAMFLPGIFILQRPENPQAAPKYQRSGLRKEEALTYVQIINSYIQLEKPYCNPDFDLFTLAEKTGINRNYITEVLNLYIGKSFYEFVNEHRVEVAKQLLWDKKYEQLTIVAIGMEAGFRSKTSFNTNFKKITGYTPSQWKEAGGTYTSNKSEVSSC